MGPNKGTNLVWGQWDLNIAGKWVQLPEHDFASRYYPESDLVKSMQWQ